MKVLFTKGLPASGKSTWAKEFCSKNIDWIRVSRDDIRNMRGKYWIPKQEKLITAIERSCILVALGFEKNVVVDATNLNEGFKNNLIELIKSHYPDTEIETKYFEIDVDEAIKRDLKRDASVGEAVIRGMYDKYLAPAPVIYKEDASLPKAVIFDVDGTLAKMNGRSPFEWKRVKEVLPKEEIIKLAKHRFLYRSHRQNEPIISHFKESIQKSANNPPD